MTAGIVKRLHKGIDIENRVITETHDFRMKMVDLNELLWSIHGWNSGLPEFQALIRKVIDEVDTTRQLFTLTAKREVQIVLEEKGSIKKWKMQFAEPQVQAQWSRKKTYQFHEATAQEVAITHEFLGNIRRLLQDCSRYFTIDVKAAEVRDVKVKLGQTEKQFRKVMDGIIKFVLAYEAIFRKESKRLKRLADSI